MMKTQIGLGVLAIPSVLDVLGMIPGTIILLAIAAITTWSDYYIGVFKLRHRSVYGIDDAGQKFAGRIGREVLGAAFVLCEFICVAEIKFLLTSPSLDLRCWRWYAWYLNWPECRLESRNLHCDFRCDWFHYRVYALQHSDPRQNILALLAWIDMYYDRK
jgi:hypothetical protein